uniref:RNA helicase n=1 Tax=Arcella intermedia TaxID=1963864 RepID=A0A6B2L7V8_9EUKA
MEGNRNKKRTQQQGDPTTANKKRKQSQSAASASGGGEGKKRSQSMPVAGAKAKERKELMEFRKNLPIYSAKEKIKEEIANNTSLIIIGETGSGKTTQIPQFVHEAIHAPKGGIAVTQPRRIAAISVAARVAQEMDVELGQLVGYHVRFDKKLSKNTKITFLTDGMLLREAMIDPLLSAYHTVLLDEAHERSLETDILFALLVDIQKKRAQKTEKNLPPIKLIIMSATLDAELFEKYFNAKVLYVKGRQFPVKIYYTPSPERNYVDAALITTLQIHLDEPPGDILVFLTGRYEIESLDKLLQSRSKILPPNSPKLITCPLFGALNSNVQQRVFDPTPPGTRKIVIATNIAETSITVPNIKYID